MEVIVKKIKGTIKETISEIFAKFDLFNRSGEVNKVFIKVNAIDFKPLCYTSPEVLESLLIYLKERGIEHIYVMENCTQSNLTRLVFEVVGFTKLCKKYGAQPLFLDECKKVQVPLDNFGYRVSVSKIIYNELIKKKNGSFYISLPKLKTHSMTVVTLGVKNQFGFISHKDRIEDHNKNIHRKIADIYHIIKPDFTLIDGIHAVFYGHYPPTSKLNECTEKLDILIGGKNTVAVDLVGSQILGYKSFEIPHLDILVKEGYSTSNPQFESDFEFPAKKYPFDLIPCFPKDVVVLKGSERVCREGCCKNTEAVLQVLYLDYNGAGNFSIVMGKGFDRNELKNLKPPILIVGDCARGETYFYLTQKFGRKNIYYSLGCNNLSATFSALSKLMKVKIHKIVPVNKLKLIYLYLNAKLRGSDVLLPPLY